jgi:hypothetical protein
LIYGYTIENTICKWIELLLTFRFHFLHFSWLNPA